MRYEYFQWDAEIRKKISSFKELLKIFNHLLLITAGNIEAATRLLQRLQKKGYLDEKINLSEFLQQLKKAGFVVDGEIRNRPMTLTRKGERQLRNASLEEIFNSLEKGLQGNHFIQQPQATGERLSETRPYDFGDNIQEIDYNSSLKNALKRVDLEHFSLQYEDLEVYEKEHATSCATVLLLDISHSMILYGEDRITPAKKIALALSELIMTRYPKDQLEVVLFGNEAIDIQVKDIPYVQVGPFHTNTCAGLQRAQQILNRSKHPNKQIFMITDGKATCIQLKDGTLYKNSFELDPQILNPTLNEAAKCKRRHIQITTFMVTRDPTLVQFVDKLTQINRGKAYYTSLENLGEALLVDYVRNRKRRIH